MHCDSDTKTFVTKYGSFPVDQYFSKDIELPIENNSIHRIRRIVCNGFPKERSLSIIWGTLTYSSNYYVDHLLLFSEEQLFTENPDKVELAVFFKGHRFMDWYSDQVLGYVDDKTVMLIHKGLTEGWTPKQLRNKVRKQMQNA